MGRARVKIVKRKVIVRKVKGGWQRVRSSQVVTPAKTAAPLLPELPPLYQRPSLLLLGVAGGGSELVWQALWRVSRLWSPLHPRAHGQIFNPAPYGLPPLPFHATSDDDYRRASAELDKYPRGFLLHDVVQPHLLLRYVQEHPGRFQIVALADVPAELRGTAAIEFSMTAFEQQGDTLLREFLDTLGYPPLA